MREPRKTSLRRWLKGAMLKRMHRMITCKEFEDFVVDYFDDALTSRQRSVFEWHLRLCRECREYLAGYQRAIECSRVALASAGDHLPEDVPEDLIRAILDARRH